MSLAFVRGIHQSPVNSPHKGPAMRKMFPYDDVIIVQSQYGLCDSIMQNPSEMALTSAKNIQQCERINADPIY